MTDKYPHILLTVLFLLGIALPKVSYADEPEKRVISIGGNVYGGGESANVGSTDVTINEGVYGKNIFGGGMGELYNDKTVKASADVEGSTSVTINGGEFAVKYDEESSAVVKPFIEHYNIYGGGNIASSVGETHVYVSKGMIAKNSDGTGNFLKNSNPQGIAQAYYQEGQMYFCIFGGGYGKNTSVIGDTWVDFNIIDMTDINSTAIEDDLLEYQSYLDIIGGGFNGIIGGNTNVHVGGNAMCRNVYGGGLYATIGSKGRAGSSGNTNVHITGGNIDNVYGGGVMGDIMTSTNVNIGLREALTFDEHEYSVENDKVKVLMSVFGANDVSGKVPQANIKHNGGTIDQNIFGAGNGDYIGYYTPGLCDYAEGDNDNYYYVDHSGDISTDGNNTVGPKGNTYKGRPQTGNVNIMIAGTSTDDRATVLGQVFGGGNSCTVGEWETNLSSKYEGDPHKWRDDPEYFKGGGNLNITLGSHIKIGRTHAELTTASEDDKEAYLAKGENVSGLYMGCSGRHLATQGTSAESNSYHHYYDRVTAKYYPGFAVFADNGTPLSRAEGLASFNAYLNNILIWSDNVTLIIDDDVEDVWLSNFVGGGFRGSMKAHSDEGQFHYSLPRGVTIGHDIVGGAYNTDVVYRVYDTESDMHTYKVSDGHYVYRTDIKSGWNEGEDYHHVEYADDGTTINGIVRFYYDGGVLSHNDSGTRHKGVFTAYGSGDDNVVDFSGYDSEKGLRLYKDKALVYIDARCQLEPEVIDGHVHGGNVFGGCFESGTVDGDIWTDYRCYIAGKWYGNENFNGGPKMFANAADYQQNFAMMVFGAGYGKNTSIKGDAYLRIIYNNESSTATYPCLYNVFGGSFQGTVDGNANVYYNAGQQGLCVGGIYGGGSQGYVAGKSFVELAGGYIANVYGGAREANVGKGTHVWAYDGALRNWADDLTEHDDAPLVVERMFGGSDVSGLIGFKANAKDVSDNEGRVQGAGWTAYFSTSNWPEELYINGRDDSEGLKTFDSYIQVGGTDHSTRGYPLIGQIYAGGNGENTDTEHGHILPGINTALIELNDGNVIEAFGGGNAATVHEQNYILTNGQYAPVNVIAMPNPLLTQIMQQRVLCHAPDSYTLSDNTFTFKPYNVQRLFGGNNLATMAIQPKWNLKSGRLGSVYSGGNEGDMTYYNALGGTVGHETESKGLSITVNSDFIHIESLYGGCRMSDVRAMYGDTPGAFEEYEYGATVNIMAGYINNVYGGNDISGNVVNGTNVNITGAVSGNVYGSGNGNYTYVWDKDVTKVTEVYDEKERYSYYKVPKYYGTDNANDAEKILTINHWRPSVAKAYLNIAGSAEHVAFVKGNVYCGGNASTVEGENSHTKFDIGSYVTLNGVFMGSDGKEFSTNDNIRRFETLNKFDMTSAVEWPASWTDKNGDACAVAVADEDKRFYPSMLSLYMKAVEMNALPKGFQASLDQERRNAYIGVFCGGGNCGSMTIDKTVNMSLPNSITIYDKVVAGCLDASKTYKNGTKEVTNVGGYYRPLKNSERTKLNYTIECQFQPKVMDVPDDMGSINSHGDDFATALGYGFLYNNIGTKIVRGEELPVYNVGCNIYGGCYHSGDVLGDVVLNVKSAMLKYPLEDSDRRTRLENTIKAEIAAFNVYGAGFDLGSHVYGNVTITLDNTDDEGNLPAFDKLTCPSVSNINGGGRSGYLYGNSYINVLNGIVYNNVIGGSDAGYQYGSTHIAVGDPEMYECNTQGEYTLDRADKWNEDKVNHDGTHPVTTSMNLIEGDRVSEAVYNKITNRGTAFTTCYVPGSAAGSRLNWSNRMIHIGAGIYAGGYALSTGSAIYAGDYTVRKLKEGNRWKDVNTGAFITTLDGYAGNANIMIADDPHNTTTGTTDHITISTIKAREKSGMKSKMGYFTRTETGTTDALGNLVYSYDHQSDGDPVSGTTYYELAGEGGIYGDGHLSFVEGYRSADIQRYGYAEHVPQDPKLLNTMQRLDFVRVKDCCLMLQGATDFAVNAHSGIDYSIARVRELYLESSIDPTVKLDKGRANSDVDSADRRHETKRSRNYLGFFNNVHYIGAIATNDNFGTDKYHDEEGALVGAKTYQANKQEYINADYNESTHEVKEGEISSGVTHFDHFKMRNIGTARNMIGINNGYTLKIQNVYTTAEQLSDGSYENVQDHIYYGPIVGVAEVKLLTLVVGEGGGYVYADNVHSDGSHFMNTSGNFVFPGTVDASNPQYVVDDCFPKNFAGTQSSTEHQNPEAHDEERPAHYWYVMGNKYFFTNTISAYTFGDEDFTGEKDLHFDMDNLDQIITLSGTQKTDVVRIKNIVWEHPHDSHYTEPGQSCDLADASKTGYSFYLSASTSDKYNTDGGYTELPRTDRPGEVNLSYDAGNDNGQESPLLAIRLNDSQVNNTANYWRNHLSDPCRVTFELESGTGDPNDYYHYFITLNIVYVQGPRVTGKLNIDNCALPGELIHAEARDLIIETDEAMPVTGTTWRYVNPDPAPDAPDTEKYAYVASYNSYIEHSKADLLAKYRYNGWGLQYVVNAGGNHFPVSLDPESRFKSMLVHNYHDMSHVNEVKEDAADELDPQAGARLYIKDKDGWDAFVAYLNEATVSNALGIPEGMEGIKVYLQNDIALDVVPEITVPFKGELNGDGYSITFSEEKAGSLFRTGMLADEAKIYNLGVVNAAGIKTDGEATIENSFHTMADATEPAILYGKTAYNLSHCYHTDDAADGFINGNRFAKGEEITPADGETPAVYAGGDWQYARTSVYDSRMLRTGEPNYGSVESKHITAHTASAIERHDCLFFGQTLNPMAEKKYPVHIDESQTATAWNETNRIYRTAGYYGSSDNDGFHYNKVAWAMQPTLTAIDFTATNPAGGFYGLTDDRPTALTSFDSYSNAAVPGDYSNETNSRVSQNLLVYNAGEPLFAKTDSIDFEDCLEKEILYHNIVKRDGVFGTDYFHLVDKQDFWAPIAFNVGTRAWYERYPQAYRNVDLGYGAGSAWEGIVLPFTAKKVTASVNGEISHFYGEDKLNHEYWLRGFMGASDDGKSATFARPAISGDDYFTQVKTGISYVYPKNDYFTSLLDYNAHYDTRDDEGVDVMGEHDEAWYAKSHTFAEYVPLTAAVPYIVAFPGNDFYEFSMEGTDYSTASHSKSGEGQMATFEASRAAGDPVITIPVTDAMLTTVGDYQHTGTFLRVIGEKTTNAVGTAFVDTDEDSQPAVTFPFRTYMTVPNTTRAIWITDGEQDADGNDADQDADEPGNPEEALGNHDLRIYVTDHALIIESTYDTSLSLCTASGHTLRRLQVAKGTNRYENLPQGFYIVGTTKLLLP